MQNEWIIVGVDPGMTTAYAIMNIDGEIIKINSKREFGLNALIEEIIKNGNVIAIASDIPIVPSFVLEVAKKFNAPVVKPDEEVRMQKKRVIIKNFNKELLKITKNNHEISALAATIIACKHFSSLLNKIKTLNIAEERKREVFLSILTRRSTNIKEAIDMLGKKL